MKAHDLVYGLRTAGDPQLSPDGEHIVYALAQADPAAPSERPRSRLWRACRDGSEAVALTAAGGRHGLPRISPDGTTVAFTSDREGESAVFTVPLAGGEPLQVAAHPFSITWLAWAPDSRHLAYTVPVEPEDKTAGPSPVVRVTRRPDYKEDVRGYLGARRIQAFVADVAERTTRQVSKGSDDFMFPVFSPDGRTLAYRSSHATGMRSHLVLQDLVSGTETQVRVGDEATATVAVWSFSPTGDRLLISATPERIPQPDLFLYTVASGDLERLTDDLEVVPDAGQPNAVPPSPMVWLDEDRVLLHGQYRGGSGLFELSVRNRALASLTDWKATNVGLSTDHAGRWAVQGHASLESVGEISLFDRETGTTKIVTGYNTELLAGSPPARWERIEVLRGEIITEAWVLFPPGFDETQRYPVVMDIHGGPHAHHGYIFNPIQQAIAGSGVIVVCANPRGSGTYGRSFATQVIGDWGGEDYLDLMAVVDRLCERPYLDSARTGVWGYSYGGFMTSWIIGHTDRFKAAVCGAPCFNLVSMYGTSDIGAVWGVTEWAGTPVDSVEAYRAHSPSTFAHKATTPTLIIHGEADERCPIGQGEEMYTALHVAGCEVEFARYPGGAHAFIRQGPPAQREDVINRVVAWFSSHLSGSAVTSEDQRTLVSR